MQQSLSPGLKRKTPKASGTKTQRRQHTDSLVKSESQVKPNSQETRKSERQKGDRGRSGLSEAP